MTDYHSFFQDHGGTVMNNGGQTASLSSVPSALSRWTEETRVLEADSMHDAVTGEMKGALSLSLIIL